VRRYIVLQLGCVAASLCAQPANSKSSPDIQAFHAYALAELGRHGDAAAAFERIHGPDEDGAALGLERSAYERALQYTQDCAKDKSCMAEDFLAIGKYPEALSWQKQQINSIRDEQKTNLRKGDTTDGTGITMQAGDEIDSTGGKSVALADAYDLQARIEAAMGQLAPALRDLDSAFKTLPANPKTVPRQAGYAYHRALILAEDRQFANAAKACRESLSLDGSDTTLGERRQSQCTAIEAMASASAPVR